MSDDQEKLRANFEGVKIAEKYANSPYRFGTLYPTGELTVRTPLGTKPPSLTESWSPTISNASNSFVYDDEEEESTKMYWSPDHGLTPQLHSRNPKFVTWVYVLKPSTSSSEDSPGSSKYSGEWVLLDESNGEDYEELFPEKECSSSSSPSSASFDATQRTVEPEEKKDGVDDVKLVGSLEDNPSESTFKLRKKWKESMRGICAPECDHPNIEGFPLKKPFK